MRTLHQLLAHISSPLDRMDHPIGQFVLDSRKIRENDVFLAVVGEYTDGHHYIQEAFARGACAVIGSQPFMVTGDQLYIQTPDVRELITSMAKMWRKLFQGRVVAVTGSVGKTTTKEMLYHVLSSQFRCEASLGNYNNKWGVPLTIINTPLERDILILEVGATHKGDIAHLMQWVDADCALITYIGQGHTESMGDLYGVGRCKFEMLSFLRPEAWAIVRDVDTQYFPKTVRPPCIFAGKDVYLTGIKHGFRSTHATVHWDFRDLAGSRILESFPLDIATTGQGMLENALMVSAVCAVMAMTPKAIQEAFVQYRPYAGRGETFQWKGVEIIDESYNANPSSVRSTLDSLQYAPYPRLVVLGDMLELGESSQEEHEAIIEYVNGLDIQIVFVKGEHMQNAASKLQCMCYTATTVEDLKEKILKHGIRSVMIKGSHSIGLEAWVKHLREEGS